MYIILNTADFSANNIGTLDQWSISCNRPKGITWSGLTSAVDKGSNFNAVAEIDTANYELVTMSVTMGATTQSGVGTSGGITISNSGSRYTITISSVTANVNISVTTKNLSTETPGSGGGSGGGGTPTPTTYTFTVNPTPSTATVTLSATGYTTVTGTGSKSITVANGTVVNWSVNADGYTTRTDIYTVNRSNETLSIVLVKESSSSESIDINIITGQYLTNTGEIAISANWNVTDYIAVNPSSIYTYYGNTSLTDAPMAVYCYDSNKSPIEALLTRINAPSGYLFETTANTAYIRLCSHKDTALKLEYTPNELIVGYVNGSYVSKTGEIVSDSGWSRTDYIDISNRKSIKYTGTVPEGKLESVAAIYGYDAGKNPIEMVLAPSTTEHVNGYVVTLTNDNIKYIIATGYTRHYEAFSVKFVQ